jgi:uncharacterized repeat protein (TIGR01451 family)
MMHRFIRTIAVFSVVLGLGLVTTASAATSADLSVSIKEETSGPYAPGSLVTYRIRAFNEATSTASSYGVYTTVAASSVAPLIPLAPAPDSNCILSMPSKTFVCEYFRIDAGKAKFQTISFRVPETLTSCPLAVSPKVQIASRLTQDLNAANNINKARPDTAIQCATNSSADVSVTQQVASSVEEGSSIVSILTVINNGPAVAQSTFVTQDIPTGLTFVPSQSYPFCFQIGATVRCNAATMTVGQVQTMPIVYTVIDNGVFCSARSVSLRTQVSSAVTDAVSVNNTVQSNIAVTCKAQPQMSITQKGTSLTDTVVKNQKNVNLLRFEARANQVTDLLLTGATFTANNLTNGSAQLTLVNAQNYSLWVDTNADGIVDTILQSGRAAQGGEVSLYAIAGGGYVVPKNQSVIFEVHADIAPSFNTAQPQLQLAFKTTSSFAIEAETLADGSSLFGNQIQLSTVPSTLYTLRSQGDLYVTKSSTPVPHRQLLGGALSEEILRLKFHAEYEDIDVTNVVISSDAQDASLFSSNVDRLELYKIGAVTPFATATVAGCGSSSVPSNSMCASLQNQEFIISKGSDVEVLVRARMRTDVDGAVSGSRVTLMVDRFSGVSAHGLTSFNNLLQSNGNTVAEGEIFISATAPTVSQSIIGRENSVILSKITSITNVDPNVSGTAIPTGVNKAIGQFKFSAAAANNTKNGSNKFVLDTIIFNVSMINVDIDATAYKLYNKADPTMKADCTSEQLSGSSASLVRCTNLRSSLVDTQISPNTDATFVLETTIQNSKVSNALSSSLQVSLANFTNPSAVGVSPSFSMSRISWLDQDISSSTQFFWIEYPESSVNGTQYQN